MEEYTLESLIETFERHSKKYEKTYKPIEEVEYFNLSKALACISKEIKNLKEKT